MTQKVNKSIDQEEATVLSNIVSLAQELLSGGAAAAKDGGAMDGLMGGVAAKAGEDHKEPDADDAAKKAKEEAEKAARKAKNEDPDNMDDKKDKVTVSKDQVSTPSDVSTANDPATDRMEDVLSTLTEENVDEVAKAIQLIRAAKAKKVQKSASSPMVAAIVELTKVVKDLSSRQGDTETAIVSILDGIGVTKQLETSMAADAQRVEKSNRAPVFHDNEKLAKSLGDLISVMKGKQTEEVRDAGSNARTVRKNLDTAVASLLR